MAVAGLDHAARSSWRARSDSPIGRYLKDYPNAGFATKVAAGGKPSLDVFALNVRRWMRASGRTPPFGGINYGVLSESEA